MVSLIDRFEKWNAKNLVCLLHVSFSDACHYKALLKFLFFIGEIKSVAMPKKANNDLKGFGLVTYVNNNDADKAYKELKKTALRNKIVIDPEQSTNVSIPKLEGNYKLKITLQILFVHILSFFSLFFAILLIEQQKTG